MPNYEDHLREAAAWERKGDLKAALRALHRAERQTPDIDELAHVALWRERLGVALAGKDGE